MLKGNARSLNKLMRLHFKRCYTFVDEAAKLPTIPSNEWPDVASYLTETSGVFTR